MRAAKPSGCARRYIRLALFFLLNEFVRLTVRYRSKKASLVVRLDAIGDFLIWLQAGAAEASTIAREHGHSVLLAKPDWADFARSLNLFDEVWTVDPERFKVDLRYRLALQIRIRRHGFSFVILPRASREILLDDSIVRISGALHRIGNLGDTRNTNRRLMQIGNSWYSKLITVPIGPVHEIVRSKAFARGLAGAELQPVAVEFDVPVRERFGIGGDYFLIATGAGWTGRRWPAERFGVVASWLQKKTGFQCVLVGGPGDREMSACVAQVLGDSCIDLTGRTSLVETGALLKGAWVAIANESAIAQFAPFVGTRVIVLLGGGHFGWFLPHPESTPATIRPISVYRQMECFGCNWKCKFDVAPEAVVPCIDRIPVEDVCAALEHELSWPPPAALR